MKTKTTMKALRRRAEKEAAQKIHRQQKGDNTLQKLVHECGLMSEEEKLSWFLEHNSGYCSGKRNGCPHCKPE